MGRMPESGIPESSFWAQPKREGASAFLDPGGSV